MCVHIKKLTGKNSTLYVSRLWGGQSDGNVLQLTISNSDEISRIELTQDQARELSEVLPKAFDTHLYPAGYGKE